MTSFEVAEKLEVSTEEVRKYKGTFRYHVSYYWGVTRDATALINRIKAKIPEAVVLDSGNHFHSFVGGAKSGSAKDSFLWVHFRLD